jgi:hypothetical protein
MTIERFCRILNSYNSQECFHSKGGSTIGSQNVEPPFEWKLPRLERLLDGPGANNSAVLGGIQFAAVVGKPDG